MLDKLEEIQQAGLKALEFVENEIGLDQWKVIHLGRNSAIMDVFKNMGSVSKEERGKIR